MGGYRRFCVQCGTEMKQGARFCANCGRPAAANSPQPAVMDEHDVATSDLQPPAPSAAWDASAVPPDGARFPPPGSGFPPPDAPFPPEGPPFPWDDTAAGLPFPRDDDTAADGLPFPRDDIAATQTRPAAPSKGLALPSASPAVASALQPAGPPPAAGSAYPAPTGSDTAQFAQNWMNDVGFSPRWEPSPPSLPDGDQADGDRPRPRRLLVAALFALVAAVIVVPALLIAHSLNGITGGSPAAAQPTAKQPGRGATAAAPSQRTAAAGLVTLLALTAADRSSIVDAVGAVERCTPALGQAPQEFQNAAASRERLLRQLASLPGRSALPAPMLQELSGAWQASAAVDTDLGRWAQDEAARGCKPGDHADANFQASNGPDIQATNDKTAFVSMWNAIAAKYALTRYRTSQL